MKAQVYVTLRNGVLDPQGKAIEGALHSMGFGGVENVRQGKFIEIELDATDRNEATMQLKQMCEKLLANTVVEDYRFELLDKAS